MSPTSSSASTSVPPPGTVFSSGSGSATLGTVAMLGRVPLRVTVVASTPEGITIRVDESPWRGSYALEGVECVPAAQVATAAWGVTADAYVIDRGGKVRYNHFNGHGWEHKPWPLIDGVTCDPLGRDRRGRTSRRSRRGVRHRPLGRRSPEAAPAPDLVCRHGRRCPGVGSSPQSSLAAARIDDDHLLLCGVRPDGQISRVEVGEAGTLASWVSAPPMAMSHVAATPDDAARGRIYAVAASNPDRSIWATPDIASPDPGIWSAVGTLAFAGGRPLAATRMLGGGEVVTVGTDTVRLLSWTGSDWIEDEFGPMPRDPAGGLAVMSRVDESLDVLYIDSAGIGPGVALVPPQGLRSSVEPVRLGGDRRPAGRNRSLRARSERRGRWDGRGRSEVIGAVGAAADAAVPDRDHQRRGKAAARCIPDAERPIRGRRGRRWIARDRAGGSGWALGDVLPRGAPRLRPRSGAGDDQVHRRGPLLERGRRRWGRPRRGQERREGVGEIQSRCEAVTP